MSTSSNIVSLRIIVHGRVQGVGFRQFTLGKARQHNIKGQVRNMADKTVECIAQAEAQKIDVFLNDLKKGPLFSRVDQIDTETISTTPEQFIDFRIVS